jgi:hypothetical protein
LKPQQLPAKYNLLLEWFQKNHESRKHQATVGLSIPSLSLTALASNGRNSNQFIMETLASAMQTKTRLNDCREKAIIGKLGEIISGTHKGVAGYYVSLLLATARKLHQVLNTEAIIFLSHENALRRAEDLRVAIKARKRPALSIEQRKHRAVRVLLVRPNPNYLVGLAA